MLQVSTGMTHREEQARSVTAPVTDDSRLIGTDPLRLWGSTHHQPPSAEACLTALSVWVQVLFFLKTL